MDDLTPGKRLKQLREHRQMSLAQLASCLDRPLSRQSIAKYEADIMLPRYSVLQSLCQALCISPEYILHGCDYQFSIPQYRNRSGCALPSAVLETLLAETNTWLASYLHAESLGHRTMNFVNEKAMQGVVLAHTDGNVPNMIVNIPDQTAYTLGYLIYFFEVAVGISGYLNGINPFNQPGVEAYKKNMFALLGRPGYEELTKELNARLDK